MYTRHFDSVKKLVICCFIQVANAVTGILLLLPACKIMYTDTAMHVKGDSAYGSWPMLRHNITAFCSALQLDCWRFFVIVDGTTLLIGKDFVLH